MSQWKSKEDFLKAKALEEARKAGLEAPEKDEEGKDINPHIPQYISKVPWYLNKGVPSLRHQRAQKEDKGSKINDWYTKGVKANSAATKYVKGACKNCGSTSHKEKECTERPRRRGAKLTGMDIQPEEVVQNIELDYDGKRDTWNGFDPSNYKETVERFNMIEMERRKLKAQELTKAQAKEAQAGGDSNTAAVSSSTTGEDSDEEQDDDKARDDVNTVGGYFGAKSRSTVRHLRIREDTAKYLHNLNPDSAYYDPKTRSMRDNPNPHINPEELVYAGDNERRHTGQWGQFVDMQKFALEAAESGQDVNLLAVPSQAELMYKTLKQKKEEQKSVQQNQIYAKYGGEKYLKPSELDLGQTELYVEYTRDGRVSGGKEKAVPKSKYEEDVFLNGHTSVWGSFWADGKWGYACCKSTTFKSACPLSQPVPMVVPLPEPAQNSGASNHETESTEESTVALPRPSPAASSTSAATSSGSPKQPVGSAEEERSPKEKRKATKHRRDESDEEDEDVAKKKQKYGSQQEDFTVSEEQMEEYHRKKSLFEDPMKNYVGK